MDDRDDLVVDFRSLSAAKKHIDATYRLAHDMLIRMQQVSFHISDWTSFGSTIAIACLDESDEIEFERFKIEEQKLFDVRINCAKQLEDLLQSLSPMKRELQRHVNPLVDILDTILPSTLGTVSLPEQPISGRFAFFFFYSLSVGVEDWGRRYSRILRSSYRNMMFGEIRQIVEKANESFPFTDAIHSTLFKRLNEERSLLLLRLKDYREIVIDSGSDSDSSGSVEPVASAVLKKHETKTKRVVPALNQSNGEWIANTQLANRDAGLPSRQTMRSCKEARNVNDEHGTYNVDKAGRISRKDERGGVWYLRRTLLNSKLHPKPLKSSGNRKG